MVTDKSLSLEGYVVKGAGVDEFLSRVQGVFKKIENDSPAADLN